MIENIKKIILLAMVIRQQFSRLLGVFDPIDNKYGKSNQKYHKVERRNEICVEEDSNRSISISYFLFFISPISLIHD